jgi:DNA invertase Pin-like site-specific DNA recombinase
MTRVDAVYVRKSTSPQEEQSQIDAIQDYLKRNSLAVDAEYWFTDTGSRHRPEDRPDFQRMLKLLEQKRIRRVYVWKQDRIVSGVKLWGHIMYLFEKAGTQLIDILTGKDLAADDIATEITTVVNARGAKEEQIKISNNTLRAKVSLAKEGMPISKLPPYGYDKKYTDAVGNHLWTTHVLTAARKRGGTKYLIIMPDGNRYERPVSPRKTKSDRIVYVPSSEAPQRVEVVRYAFKVFGEEAITVAALAIRLNQLGYTIYGKPWLKTSLEGILRNPVYVGCVRLGNVTRGEFTTYDGTRLLPAHNPDRKITRNPIERQIITPDRHEPIIDRETWDRVQRKLKGRRERPAPPRRDDLWLRGLLVCGKCGRTMNTFRQGKTIKGYICGSYYRYSQTRSKQEFTGCARNWVPHEEVEKLVAKHLEGMADDLRTAGEAEALNAIINECLGAKHQLTVVMERGLRDYVRELYEMFASEDAGEARFRRLLARYTGRPIKDDDLRKKIDELAVRWGVFTVAEARNLFICFEEEKVKLAKRKLAGLNREYERWVLAKATAENDRERGMARARCQELENELTAWEFRLTPLDDQLANLRSYLTDHLGRLDRAVQSLTAGSYRRKAAVVGELFDQIVLHFRQIKAEKQVRSEFLPDRTEFEVSVMDVTSPRNSHRFRGPAPKGTRPRLDFRKRNRWC